MPRSLQRPQRAVQHLLSVRVLTWGRGIWTPEWVCVPRTRRVRNRNPLSPPLLATPPTRPCALVLPLGACHSYPPCALPDRAQPQPQMVSQLTHMPARAPVSYCAYPHACPQPHPPTAFPPPPIHPPIHPPMCLYSYPNPGQPHHPPPPTHVPVQVVHGQQGVHVVGVLLQQVGDGGGVVAGLGGGGVRERCGVTTMTVQCDGLLMPMPWLLTRMHQTH